MPVPTPGSFSYGINLLAFPNNSGAFICAANPAVLGELSPTMTAGSIANIASSSARTNGYGVLLQYDQSKQLTLTEDATVIAFLGRATPALEIGQMLFDQIALGYRWPPKAYAMGSATYYPNGTVDPSPPSTNSVEYAIRQMLMAQHTGSLILYQDAKGRYLLGALLNVQLGDLIDPAGWLTFTATFYQTWGSFFIPNS